MDGKILCFPDDFLISSSSYGLDNELDLPYFVFIQGTDYIMSYFDNGEEDMNDDDDGLDDGPVY